MKIGYEIVEVDQPAWEIIGGGLTAFNTQQAGEDNGKKLCFVVKKPDGQNVGGVIGATYWNWLYINLMWIQEDLRDQGYGKQLLGLAEEKARQRGAKHAYLDTFSFQALDFYMKLGYEVFGELQDFPQGHQRFFMKKQL